MRNLARLVTQPVRTVFLLGATLFLGACAHQQRLEVAPIAHIVQVKLVDPSEAGQLMVETREQLGAIPEVASLHLGRHVDIGRDTIVSDYDVCLIVGFESVDDYLAYIEHPLHVELVDEWRDRWEWIRIYDVLDEDR